MSESENTSPFSARTLIKSDSVRVEDMDITWADVEFHINKWAEEWLEDDYFMTITSGKDSLSHHSPASLHRLDDATDWRIRDLPFKAYKFKPYGRAWKEILKAATYDLGRRLWGVRVYDNQGTAQVPVVVLEKTHLHIQAGYANIIRANTKTNVYISNKFKQFEPTGE